MRSLRTTKLGTFLATLCVALATVLVSQSTIAIVNQVQHSPMAEHPASALGGQVHLDHDDHQRDHALQQISTAEDAPTDGSAHHHHADGPQFAPLPHGVVTSVVSAQALSLRRPSDAPPASDMTLGLERPPRASLEVIT